MSAKTVKYSPGPNCSREKRKKGDDEVVKLSHEIGGDSEASILHSIGMLESLNNVPEHVMERHMRTEYEQSEQPAGKDVEQTNASSFLIFRTLIIYT